MPESRKLEKNPVSELLRPQRISHEISHDKKRYSASTTRLGPLIVKDGVQCQDRPSQICGRQSESEEASLLVLACPLFVSFNQCTIVSVIK
jgi:hypothetical protein